MTWRDVLAAGAFEPTVGQARGKLEAYLAEYPEDEEVLNRAIQANEEEYGAGFVPSAIRHLVAEYEPDMDGGEVYGLLLNALPLHVEFAGEPIDELP